MSNSVRDDDAILDDLGRRLARHRLDLGLTQAELARQAGVGRATVERIEAGHSTQLTSLIRILRVLDKVDALVGILPAPGLRPVDLVRRTSKPRQRASGRRRRGDDARDHPWEWAEEE